jgi:hypothetical protein
MKDALHKMTDEERERRMNTYRNDLANWPDMAQMDEPEERREWNPVALMVLTYVGILCVVVAWVVVGTI